MPNKQNQRSRIDLLFVFNLRKILEESGVSQNQLAYRSSIQKSSISRILACKEQVSLTRADRIAKALQRPLTDLLRDPKQDR